MYITVDSIGTDTGDTSISPDKLFCADRAVRVLDYAGYMSAF